MIVGTVSVLIFLSFLSLLIFQDIFSGYFLGASFCTSVFVYLQPSVLLADITGMKQKDKRIFRVSYRTVLHRLDKKDADSGNVWAQFETDYKRQYGRALLENQEPERLSRVDFAGDRLSRLVRKAIEGEKISLGRGAEILGISHQEMRDLAASWTG